MDAADYAAYPLHDRLRFHARVGACVGTTDHLQDCEDAADQLEAAVKRISDLLTANNAYLERARAAEAKNEQLLHAVKVTVHKPHAPIAATFVDVGVIIERSRG